MEITVFENKDFGKVRIVDINNEPYFVGKDVAEILGYADPRGTVSKKVEPEDKGVAKIATPNELALEYEGKSRDYKQILDAHATKELTGEFLLPLPKLDRKTYSATEIGSMLGVTASKVGSIANANGLKNDDFGIWVHDKSKYSGKEVETFRYYDTVIPELKKVLETA